MTDDTHVTQKADLQAREFRVEVAADLDLVWEALTTAEGWETWFVQNAEVNAEVGGSVKTDWGTGMMDYAVVEAVEPPRRLVLRYPESEEWAGTEEWLLSHEGGVTLVRLIHSLPVADGQTWEGTYGDIVRGWTLFLATMAFALGRHSMVGRTHEVRVGDISAEPWPQVLATLGLDVTPAAGSALTLDGVGGADVLLSFDGYSLLLGFGDAATLLIDVEGDKLYTMAAGYGSAPDADLTARLAGVAERACAAVAG